MRAKTNAISTKKSDHQLSQREKSVVTNQMHKSKDLSRRQTTIILPCYVDKQGDGNEKIEIEENWANTEIDEELEIADIYESDFHFFNHKFE